MEVRFNGRQKAEWDVTFGSKEGDAGRHFFFAGGSNIPTTRTTTVCACQDWPDASVDWSLCPGNGPAQLLKNNLGGQGPSTGDEEIRYGKVAKYKGADLDLVVTAVGDYSAYNVTRNIATTAAGLSGCFGAINVLHNTSARLRFQFQLSDGGVPDFGEDTSFGFGIYDIDADKDSPTDNEQITFNTAISQNQGPREGAAVKRLGTNPYTIASTKAGTGKDNAKTEAQVNDNEQADRSATVLYTGKSSWEVTLTTNGGVKGRNFLFHGCKPGNKWLLFPPAPFAQERAYPEEYTPP